MDLYSVYQGLREELKFNPNWAVRVEQADSPASGVDPQPRCWAGMPTPQRELDPYGQSMGGYPAAMKEFMDSQLGRFNCAANHDTFEEWWPYEAITAAASWGAQIAVIDLTETPHLKLNKQTLINRGNCTLVKVITLH